MATGTNTNPDTNFDDVSDDKIEEYFKTKDAMRTFREDLKDLKEEHEQFDQAEELSKELKILRQNINNSEDVRISLQNCYSQRENGSSERNYQGATQRI